MVSLWEGFTATLHPWTINQINCTLSSVQWHHQFDHILGIGCKNICYLRHEILLLLLVHSTSCFRSPKQSFTWTFTWKLRIFFFPATFRACLLKVREEKWELVMWNWLAVSPSNLQFCYKLNWRLMSPKIRT